MKIQNVADISFRKYGKVLEGFDFGELLRAMKHTPIPKDVIYLPTVEELEILPIAGEFQNRAYGGMPIQVGYCNGHNKKLNAVEYHRDSEVNIAVTDLIILIGSQQDITPEFTYDTANIEAFLFRQAQPLKFMQRRFIMLLVRLQTAVFRTWSYFPEKRIQSFHFSLPEVEKSAC